MGGIIELKHEGRAARGGVIWTGIKGGGEVCPRWTQSADPDAPPLTFLMKFAILSSRLAPFRQRSPHPEEIRAPQEHYSHCLSLSASIEMKWILRHAGFSAQDQILLVRVLVNLSANSGI